MALLFCYVKAAVFASGTEDLILNLFNFFRKLDNKLRLLPDLALYGDGALMKGCDLLNQGQTNSRSTSLTGAGLVGPVKTLEDKREIFFGDADACVYNLNFRKIRCSCKGNGNLTA